MPVPIGTMAARNYREHDNYTQSLKCVCSVYQGMAFSRAVRGPWMTAALAAEGLQGLKPLLLPPSVRHG
jgi:hypothetical protein